MPQHRTFLALALLLGLLAGCTNPDEATPDMGEEVNNLPQLQDEESRPDDGPECISTTTGEPTTAPEDNPCPQGQYPSGI